MGNCYHQQFQFSVENIDNFNDFDETIDISNDFEETIENFKCGSVYYREITE